MNRPWVNQFGVIEYDIFNHVPPQHYVVKWKEGFERYEKHFDNKKEARANCPGFLILRIN